MYNFNNNYPCPYYGNIPMYNLSNMYALYRTYQYPYYFDTPVYDSDFSMEYTDNYISYNAEIDYDSNFDFSRSSNDNIPMESKDYGPEPFVINIDEATKQNTAYRTALWTGSHLQVTLMSIRVGGDIGLEVHPNLDQFIRIEEGQGVVKMGDSEDMLDFEEKVYDDFAFVIPAGKWHNLINTGDVPIKLYSIYAPPQHPYGTVHETKEIAEAAEDHNH